MGTYWVTRRAARKFKAPIGSRISPKPGPDGFIVHGAADPDGNGVLLHFTASRSRAPHRGQKRLFSGAKGEKEERARYEAKTGAKITVRIGGPVHRPEIWEVSSMDRCREMCAWGDVRGCFCLGRAYTVGWASGGGKRGKVGVTINTTTARKYFKKACDMGHKKACDRLGQDNRSDMAVVKSASSDQDRTEWEEVVHEGDAQLSCRFKMPKRVFKKVSENQYSADELGTVISINSTYMNRWGDDGISDLYDLVRHSRVGLTDVESDSSQDSFTMSGRSSKGERVLIKGYCNEFESMQGRDDGEPTYLWTQTKVLTVRTTGREDEKTAKLAQEISKSFQCVY